MHLFFGFLGRYAGAFLYSQSFLTAVLHPINLIFKIQIESVYVPSIRVKGLTPGRRATVLKRCVGPQCSDEYIEESVIGEEVETNAGR